MKFTEKMLESYSEPLSATEERQCKNAIAMVRDALKALGFTDDNKEIQKLYENTLAYSFMLRNVDNKRRIKLLVQGSYANNTNVKTQSDVDIAVIQEETFRTLYRSGYMETQSDADYGFSTVQNKDKSFKDEVEECLISKFGKDVERKNKSIKIHGNSYRKDADSVPCMRHRDYTRDYRKDANNFVGGIVIFPDDGSKPIINYPEQHIKNGREKNVSTHTYYKKMVRIMKKMRYLMQEYKLTVPDSISSFALESLLWNIPDEEYLEYGQYRKVYMFDHIIKYLRNHSNDFSGYKEANGIKILFPTEREIAAINIFLENLSVFYEYE